MYMEELFGNLLVEYSSNNKKPIIVSKENLGTYLIVNELEEEAPAQNVLNVIYEAKDGNNVIGKIFALKVKNGKSVHILGSGHDNYYGFTDLGYLVEGVLKNITTLGSVNSDKNMSNNFGLSLVISYFTNQQGGILFKIPTDCSELEYKSYMTIYLVIAAIGLIRDIKLKEGVVVIGELLPNGDFVIGEGKLQNKLIAATKFSNVKEIILPFGLKNSSVFKRVINKNSINLKITYVKTIYDILPLILVNNN